MRSGTQKLLYGLLLACAAAALLMALDKMNMHTWLRDSVTTAFAVRKRTPDPPVYVLAEVESPSLSPQPLVSYVNRSVFDNWQPNPEGLSLASSAPFLTSKEEQHEAGVRIYKTMIETPATYKCKRPRLGQSRGDDWTYCTDPGYVVKPPCLVYSFGINYNYEFDDNLGRLGCEVYSFDPSMTTSDHRRNAHVVFYRIGLGDHDNDTYVPRFNKYVKEKTFWTLRTLKTLVTALGHAERTIDILKMDVEGTEWGVIRNMLDTGVLKQVKQLLVEWHIFPNDPPIGTFRRLQKVLDDLKAAGFLLFKKEKGALSVKRVGNDFRFSLSQYHLQQHACYINTNFQQP